MRNFNLVILASVIFLSPSVYAENKDNKIPVVTLGTSTPTKKVVKKTTSKKSIPTVNATFTSTPTPVAEPIPTTPTTTIPVNNKKELKEKDLTSSTPSTHDLKGSVTIGISGTAFIDFGTEEGMYLSAADNTAIVTAGSTVSDVTAGGFGANATVEYGFTDHISGTVQLGYSRLTYSNKFKAFVAENFFTGDVLANYYFLKNPKTIMPYVTAGAGVVASGEKFMPTFDAGAGMHVFVHDDISIKGQVLMKTAFVYNRLEPSVGVTYHFK